VTIDAGAFEIAARPDIVVGIPEGRMADSASCKWVRNGGSPS
jgi:hypothetical protein